MHKVVNYKVLSFYEGGISMKTSCLLFLESSDTSMAVNSVSSFIVAEKQPLYWHLIATQPSFGKSFSSEINNQLVGVAVKVYQANRK